MYALIPISLLMAFFLFVVWTHPDGKRTIIRYFPIATVSILFLSGTIAGLFMVAVPIVSSVLEKWILDTKSEIYSQIIVLIIFAISISQMTGFIFRRVILRWARKSDSTGV
jgi:hypothetical protein